jgi:vacuolar-type H+-ATPase subunit H
MAHKEIETVKNAEKKAISIIANAQERAETIIKSAKATGETTKRQDIANFKEELKGRRETADTEMVQEADAFRAKGKVEAEEYKREGSARLESAVSKIVQKVVGE